jgi:hypothetical protein
MNPWEFEDKWKQLLTDLGAARVSHIGSDENAREAAIFQLRKILNFLKETDAEGLILPLLILCSALEDLADGAMPAKILTPLKSKNRPKDDVVLRSVKLVAAVTMDQLFEYAELSRADAARAVAKAFHEAGLSTIQGRKVTPTAISKWRDLAKEAPKDSKLAREFKRFRSVGAEALTRDAPADSKRDLLLKRRLPLFFIQIGGRGPVAAKTRQRRILDIQRQIPKKPVC